MTRRATSIPARALAAAVGAAIGLAGCVTSGAEKPGPDSKRTHYTLKTGEPFLHPPPLPAQTDVKVEWHYDNGAATMQDGFRGWDFDGDGRFDMVEVLSETGATQSYVYDFDGDGRIDLERSQ